MLQNFHTHSGLLAQFKDGHPDFLSKIYVHFAPQLCQFLRKNVPHMSPFDVDDIVQDTFSRVFSNAVRAQYDAVHPFVVYLYRIAKNISIDKYRAHRRFCWVDEFKENDLRTLESNQDNNPESMQARKELSVILQSFVNKLSLSAQAILHARFILQQPRAEVCLALCISPMKLRIEEYKIKKELHAYLKRYDAELICGFLILLLMYVSLLRGHSI